MALSPLIKYIYSSGAEEVIRRGKRIFLTGGVQMIKRDEFTGQITFKVKNDMYYNQYNVTISKYHDENTLSARCTCPYNMGEICRHEAAALFMLNDMIVNQTLNASEAVFDQHHTVVRMKVIDLKSLRLFTSSYLFEEAEKIAQKNKAQITTAENEKVEATLTIDKEAFQLKIKRNDDKSFDTSCNCDETRHPLCKHKTSLFLQLLNNHGPLYFDTIRNWESQKNKLLALYGYSLDDDLTGKFDFVYQDGKPILKVLDTSIKKVNTGFTKEQLRSETPVAIEPKDYTKRLGVVLNLQETDYPYFSIDLVEGELNLEKTAFVGNVTKLDTTKYISLDQYQMEDRDIMNMVRKAQKPEIAKYIAKNSPFGDLWENIVHSQTEWTQENKESLFEYLHPKLLKIFSTLRTYNPLYLLPKGKAYKTSSLVPVNYVDNTPFPVISVHKLKKGKATKKAPNANYEIETQLGIDINGSTVSLDKNELNNPMLFLFKQDLYLIHKPMDAVKLALLEGYAKTGPDVWPSYLKDKLIPLSKLYDIKFDKELVDYKQDIKPTCCVYLSEQGSYFIIKPAFKYDDTLTNWNDEHSLSIYHDEKLIIVQRHKEQEAAFVHMLQNLHTHLRVQEAEHQFAIHSKYALQKNWFFLFFDKMKEENIEVFGYDQLNNFKIHKSKPTTKLNIASNLDWFDTNIEIDFDGQVANLSEIQKALAVKQNYVPLGDGTYGLLPEEWLQKFSLLFKMADTTGKTLRVSKYNFTVIDELHDMIDDEEVRKELSEKKEILLNTNPEKYEQLAIPSQLNAELRPYQEAGFQWGGGGGGVGLFRYGEMGWPFS